MRLWLIMLTVLTVTSFYSGAMYAYSGMDHYGHSRYKEGRTSMWEELRGYLGRGYYVNMGDIFIKPDQLRSLKARDVCTNCHLQGPPSY